MGRCRALILALMAGTLAGCSAERSSPSAALLKRFRPFQGVTGPDAVYVDVALVQIPRGDQARFRDLWTFVDELAISFEKKGMVEKNGYRVGRVSGTNPPEDLLELVTERRYCPAPRRIQMKADKDERVIDLGPTVPLGTFSIVRGEQKKQIELKQAQFCLALTPILLDNARTRLHIVPHVKHASEEVAPWRPRADRSGWALHFQQPAESFEEIGWEVELEQGEYLIVGAREDQRATLGHESFVRTEEPVPLQRLLVLRIWRPGGKQDNELLGGNETTDRGRKQAVPLAVQAAWPQIRGMRPD